MPNSIQPLVLIIEDELPIRRFLSASMAEENYRINEAATAMEAYRVAQDPVPDLIILDLGLPDEDGQIVLQKLREWYSGPILVLSARDQDVQKVQALDSGADDYVTKPFSTSELTARIRALLRRHTGMHIEPANHRIGDIEVNVADRIVTKNGQNIHLTPLEYKLLLVFLKNAHKVLTHRFLLNEVWGSGNSEELHYVRVFVANLRRKLETDPSRPAHFLTEPGIGYRLVDN